MNVGHGPMTVGKIEQLANARGCDRSTYHAGPCNGFPRPDCPSVRTFTTGATRDTDDGKLDYEAFLSPLALQRYAEYMHTNRRQKDGTLRDGDNWQKGMEPSVYMKSMWRHFMEAWTLYRKGGAEVALEVALCAVIFNAMGYLHELVKKRA